MPRPRSARLASDPSAQPVVTRASRWSSSSRVSIRIGPALRKGVLAERCRERVLQNLEGDVSAQGLELGAELFEPGRHRAGGRDSDQHRPAAERGEVASQVDCGDPVVLGRREPQAADPRLPLGGELLEGAVGRIRTPRPLRRLRSRPRPSTRSARRSPAAESSRGCTACRGSTGSMSARPASPSRSADEGRDHAARRAADQSDACSPRSLRRGPPRPPRCPRVGLRGRSRPPAPVRVEIRTDAEGREPGRREVPGEKRLEPAKVAVLRTDRRRDHPADGSALCKRCGEQRESAAGSDSALEKFLGDPGGGVLIAALTSQALEVDRHLLLACCP